MQKEQRLEIYDSSGNIVENIIEYTASEVSENINSGYGPLTIVLPRPFDDYGSNIAVDGRIKIVSNYTQERTIYSGRIVEIETSAASVENVMLGCTGHMYEATRNILEESQDVHLTFKGDIKDVLEEIIDTHRASLTNPVIDYDTGTIESPSTDVNIETFAGNVFDTMLSVIQAAPAGWFGRLGSDDNYYFSEVSSTPDHILTVGKEVVSLSKSVSVANRITRVLFYNGLAPTDPELIFKLYSDASNTREFDVLRDQRYRDEAVVSSLANRKLDTFSDPLSTIEAVVVNYDIDSIQVGDYVYFNNLEEEVEGIITQTTASKDVMKISIANRDKFVSRAILEQVQRQRLADTDQEIPESYTT